MNDYLKSTKMLNYDAREIVELIAAQKWASLNDTYDKIGAIYDYVQNAVPLGYNKYDSLTASQVLADGFGQCNTKATLITSLLRAVDVPCRLHGSKVTKEFQRGLMPKLMAKLAPPLILHTWAEVLYDDEWLSLEGVITDKIYLSGLRALFPEQRGRFFDYAVAVDDFQSLKLIGAAKPPRYSKPPSWKIWAYSTRPTRCTRDIRRSTAASKNSCTKISAEE